MTLALLLLLDAAALAAAAFVYRAIARDRLRRRFRAALARVADVPAAEPASPVAAEVAARVQATEDAKRRERFVARYAQAAEREGFRRADAEDEARRMYAELTSISVD